jgi:penicillin amidase
MNTTGQSGHAFHAHYDDMLQPWADGIHHPMRWTREQVDGAAEATLTLSPAD